MRRHSALTGSTMHATRTDVLSSTTGSQIVEFAVALPLLLVLVVGIFDFGTAFNIKQKLVNATREGARVASSQPTNDLWPPAAAGGCGAPQSVCAIRDAVDNALITNAMRDCGLAASAGAAAGNLAWAFTPGGCAGPMTLTIERGFVPPLSATLNPPFQPNYQIEMTRVTLNYPYQWTFNRVIQLLVSTANYPATTQFNSVAIMQNLN